MTRFKRIVSLKSFLELLGGLAFSLIVIAIHGYVFFYFFFLCMRIATELFSLP